MTENNAKSNVNNGGSGIKAAAALSSSSTTDDVVKWFRAHEIGDDTKEKITSWVSMQRVDGSVLIELTIDEFLREVGDIPFGERKRLQRAWPPQRK